MKLADLEAARLAAVSALGRNGQQLVARLEAAGLVVVRSADLVHEPVVLAGVRLNLREPWDGLAPIWVERPGHPDGDIAVLPVKFEAVASVREATMLQQVTGMQVSVALNDQGEVTAAWTIDE